jgi:PAS domain S-box-containing protein
MRDLPMQPDFFRRLFEASPHPYLILKSDPDFTIVAVNDRYLDATLTERERIVGHGLFQIFPDNPDDASNSGVSDLRISLNRVLAERRPDVMGVQKYDIPLRDGSGGFEVKYWSPVNTPVFDAEGGVEYIIHHVEDVTEFILGRERASRENAEQLGKVQAHADRVEAEVMRRSAEVKEANRELKAALLELARREEELARLNGRLTELDRLRSQFFANVSHELRTPLTLIMSPLARRVAAADLPEEERRESEMMLRNARLLYRHVSDLLDIAKMESGAMTMAYAQLDLAALVRTVASNFESLAGERGIDLSLAVSPLDAQIDSDKVQRIVLNLLSNAFKFTPDGGVIRIALDNQDGMALIEVADNGPGVPADLREAVFERFRQVEGGSQRRHGGTGLGLAIVRQFTELHGGSVRLDETPGGGARFTVCLPQLAPAGAVIHEPTGYLDPFFNQQGVEELRNTARPGLPEAASGSGTALVLVVEDNPDMNDYIVAALRPHYRVTSAHDGRDGLEKALALRPDLVLSDVMMPRMSGDEMAQELRQHMPDLPIVMLTAKADDELRVRMLRAGVQDYLNKPFVLDELLARVGSLIATRRSASEKLGRSEQSLRESEERLQLFIRHAPASLAMFDNTMRYLAVSRRWMDDYNLGEREIIGLSHYDVFPEIPERWKDIHRRCLAGEVIRADEDRFDRADGSVQWLRWEARPWHAVDGGIGGIVVFSEDITGYIQAQGEIRNLGERISLAAKASKVGIWDWDVANNRLIWDDQMYALYGVAREQFSGAYEAWLEGVHPDDRAASMEASQQALRGEREYDTEFRVLWPDGTVHHLKARAEVRRDATGAPLRMIGANFDVSELKRAEAEVLHLNADLERRVLERTAELTAANRELDAFAYAVSHDLRAPLRAMNGFAQALAEDYGEQIQGEARAYLEQIGIASRRMSELIEGILTLSRSTRGELRRDKVDLSALARWRLEERGREAPGRAVTTSVEDGLVVRGDGRMLEAALGNLIDNAWKYSAKVESPAIRVYAEERDGRRWFCVTDNGAGFDPAHAARLFQPFQRLHRQDEFPGLGIGLATFARIIRRHGGDIEAHGEPGQGATFCFHLGTDSLTGEQA